MLSKRGGGADLSPLDSKEIKPVIPKENQSWIFIGKTDAGSPILWPPDAKNWLTVKDPAAGKDWRHEEKGTTEVAMVERHHRLDGHEFEQAPGVGDGQGSLMCCSLWGYKESDTTKRLNCGCLCDQPHAINTLVPWVCSGLPWMVTSHIHAAVSWLGERACCVTPCDRERG